MADDTRKAVLPLAYVPAEVWRTFNGNYGKFSKVGARGGFAKDWILCQWCWHNMPSV